MVPFPVFLAVAAVCITLYYYCVKKLNYFKELGIPHVPPKPLVGNVGRLISKQSTLIDLVKNAYNVDREAKYVGYYEFLTPIVVIRDPELIKTICVKNFDHFQDHQGFSNAQADPLLHEMLFNLRGEKWKDERATLSPTFTSSKIKTMFKLMTNVAVRYANHAARLPEKERDMEMKSFLTRYTNDVIATCVYGVIVDSIKEPRNQYYIYGRQASTFTGFINSMKFLMLRHAPKIAAVLGVRMIPTYVIDFFTEELNKTVKERQERGISHPDMVQLLLEASKKKDMPMDQINAHSFGFYFGGFDSIASQTAIILHMITEHQDVQKRLQDEIDEALENNNGDLSYETIHSLKYLDAVINESLRMYPIAYFLDRVCTKSYELPPAISGGKPLTVQPGSLLWIPVEAIQTDPKYYENPDTFDPDRFLDSGKRILNSATYMPFGVGPRACIGNRFALAEVKAFICNFMARCDLKPGKKTVIPFTPEKGVINVAPKGGFWLRVEPRKNPHPSVSVGASANGMTNGA